MLDLNFTMRISFACFVPCAIFTFANICEPIISFGKISTFAAVHFFVTVLLKGRGWYHIENSQQCNRFRA